MSRGEKMNSERKAVLGAASVLLKNQLYTSDGNYRKISWHPSQQKADLEGLLERKLEEAMAALDSFRESRAFWLALDALLPGWFDLDLSDYIKGPSSFFVSNDPREWFDHMISVGIDEETAKGLLSVAGHPLEEGAS